jgi:hypothetical protein
MSQNDKYCVKGSRTQEQRHSSQWNQVLNLLCT